MRGKKIDTEFVADFIAICAKNKKMSPEEICKEAEMRITEIDIDIVRVERLKKVRAKLKDVLITFDKKPEDKSEDKLLLTFYNISNLPLAYSFCDSLLESSPVPAKEVISKYTLTVKELLPAGVIKRVNSLIEPGEKFQEFISFYEKTYK